MTGQLSFFQSWKIYLTALACGFGIIFCLNFVLPSGNLNTVQALALQLALTCVTHFLVVLLCLRWYSCRALLAQGGAVLLTNLVAITLMVGVSSLKQF